MNKKELINLVVSKKLSVRLKKAGVPQDSSYYWEIYLEGEKFEKATLQEIKFESTYHKSYSAFLAGELLSFIENKGDILTYAFEFCKDKNGDIDLFDFIGLLKDSNKLAEMLLWLIKNGHLNIRKS